MRAVTVHAFADLDAIRLEHRPDPTAGPGQVLIEIVSAPVNFVDLVTMRGEYQFRPALPYVPGKGPAGVVRDVGDGVTAVAPGDRVLAMTEYGAHAEVVAAARDQVYRLPDGLGFDDAASMSLAYDTAWMALRERGRLAAGESVLVLGSSGAVGQAAVQLAKAMGAGLVLGGVARPGRESGPVDAIVDLSLPDLRDAVREQVLALTEGRGVDVVVDMLGGDPFDGAVRSLAWRGRLVVVGFAAGRIPTLKMNYPLLKNIEVSGLQISDYRKRVPELLTRCFDEVFDLHTAGLIQPAPGTALPLTEWRTAYDTLAARNSPGRLLLHPRETA